MFDIEGHLKKLPASPGVYLMKDRDNNIIYVGKAVSLKNRVRQYFQSSRNHSKKVVSMVKNIDSFEYIITDSEVEALILECNLIKKYKPKYNILLKDDKTYPYIKVTVNEDFPRVLKVRKILKDKAKYFGPYTNVSAVNDVLDLIRDIYPIRTCNIDIDRAIRTGMRPCLNYHIKKCTGPCTGYDIKEDYKRMIDEIIMFLQGKEEKLVTMFEDKMKKAAMDLDFENAAIYRDKINSLNEVAQKQKISKLQSDNDQDVIAMANFDQEACVQIFFIRNGKISGRERFMLDGIKDNDRSEILGSFVKQFYMSQEYVPKELIVEEEIFDQEIIAQMLSSKRGSNVSIKVPKKGEKRALVLMVRKNADEYLVKFDDLKKKKYQKSLGALDELKAVLDIESDLHRIEAYDISNIQGVDSIGTMVVYTDGIKDKKEYRRFKIKTVEGPDDYASMAEVLDRRLKHGKLPDLILLDGGKGQVSAVKRVLKDNGLEIPLWGMYKDDRHRTKGLINSDKTIELDRTSSLYRFVYGIQEEVHGYSISYHRSLRDKKLTKSILDDVPGIGPKRKLALISKFKDIDKIRSASIDEIMEVDGISKKIAEDIVNILEKGEYNG
ncbi:MULTISPECIES: excinuclease ABC subunit UvrC [Peptostreptococcus]|uniref:UvrABC system protein C n=4 Tax=Peptostreptococcus anaerobius TaxID=1261 RepID=D3MPJ9_9FIRM|nr:MULTISPECIES: excinuclease ABC subunit UvrC [Peptostreptococcus]EFD05939.1 excinuclease ABC, C subunit [Peptostreptococcus anaerobius 653-L]KXI12457.1 excinuclease ABC, C subunit [Peptostreptococcus anaerobius]MBS5596776.1 excinuclease ABC subunit UvrC [Peptostreptococcus sp.]MCB6983186.1 excinuclease ABC subunit UvrC [Peptostreptococcus anaerobius]MCQ5150462.1 excinuclease ABC subunit UvrC [Peptostreptococcus anaerobius]